MITVNGAAMIGRPGTAAQVFRALADAGVNVMMISQSVSEAGISLVVSKDHGERANSGGGNYSGFVATKKPEWKLRLSISNFKNLGAKVRSFSPWLPGAPWLRFLLRK